MSVSVTGQPQSLRRPFRSQDFAVLWCATIISNIGTWMYNKAGLTEKARETLVAVYERFTEGFDTPDLVVVGLLQEQLESALNVLAVTSVWS